MRRILPLLLVLLIACKKDHQTQVTTVQSPEYIGSVSIGLNAVSTTLYEVSYWWGSPSLYGEAFPMGTSVAAFPTDIVGDFPPFAQIELVAWSGHWWELGTDWINLCVDSFYVVCPDSFDIEVDGSGADFEIVQKGFEVWGYALTDSAVYQIHTVKVYTQ